jgi:hypothetical protein
VFTPPPPTHYHTETSPVRHPRQSRWLAEWGRLKDGRPSCRCLCNAELGVSANSNELPHNDRRDQIPVCQAGLAGPVTLAIAARPCMRSVAGFLSVWETRRIPPAGVASLASYRPRDPPVRQDGSRSWRLRVVQADYGSRPRIEPGCPGSCRSLPVLVTLVPATLRIEISRSTKFPT